MEMSIGAVTTTQGAATAGSSAQPGAQGFGNLLVQQTSGGSAAASGSALPVQLVAAGIVTQELAALLTGTTNEQLNVKLDALLRQLTDREAELSEQQQAQADEALAQLNALFAQLFGFTLLPEDNLRQQLTAQQGAADGERPAAFGVEPKQRLTDALMLVQSFLQEGMMKPLSKDEALKFHAALDMLSQAVGDRQADQNAKTANVVTFASAAPQPVQSHLLRLGKQPVHAALVAVVAEAAHNGEKPAHVESTGAQPIQALQATNASNGTNVSNGFLASNAPGETALQAAAESQAPAQVQSATPAGPDASDAAKTAEQPKPVQTVPFQRLSETIAGMAVRQLNVSQNGGVTEARIMLLPEHLGQVDVRITVQNGQLTAQFTAENAAAKEMIENQLGVLRGALQNQGLQVEKLEVAYGGAAQQSQMFQEQRQRGQGGQPFQQQSGTRSGQDSVPAFEAELVEQAAIRGLGYGRAINVTA